MPTSLPAVSMNQKSGPVGSSRFNLVGKDSSENRTIMLEDWRQAWGELVAHIGFQKAAPKIDPFSRDTMTGVLGNIGIAKGGHIPTWLPKGLADICPSRIVLIAPL